MTKPDEDLDHWRWSAGGDQLQRKRGEQPIAGIAFAVAIVVTILLLVL